MLLKIVAASSYDQEGTVVPVNSGNTVLLDNDVASIQLSVNIKGFAGSHEHKENSHPDLESEEQQKLLANEKLNITLQVKPKQDIQGHQLLFGNDFGYPLRDFLPYGTAAGLRVFKYMVDPSVDGDLYAEKPWLYGKALSSFNLVNSSQNDNLPSKTGLPKEDLKLLDTTKLSAAVSSESARRKKFFTNADNLQNVTLLKDHYYLFVFHTNILSLQDNQFKISLPGGFELDLQNYLNNKVVEGHSNVRWVLKYNESQAPAGVDRGVPLAVITFQLVNEENDLSTKG